MTKILALFSILSAGFLIAMSRLSPNGIFMWFASSSIQMDYIRIAFIVLILIYLLLNNYTHIIIKGFLILLSLVIAGETVMISRTHWLGVLDYLSLALSGITVLVLTLETKSTKLAKPMKIVVRKPRLEHKYNGSHRSAHHSL